MGRPENDRTNAMTPPTRARRRALRAVLGTLASGGLTAAALGGPLAPGAFAGKFAEVPTTAEVTASSEPAGRAGTAAAPTTTPTPPAPTPTTTGTTTTPQPTAPAPQEAPAVALQRRQKTTKG